MNYLVDIYPYRDYDKYKRLSNLVVVITGIPSLVLFIMIPILIIQMVWDALIVISIFFFLMFISYLIMRGIKYSRLLINENEINVSNWFGKLKKYKCSYKNMNIDIKKSITNSYVFVLTFLDKNKHQKIKYRFSLVSRDPNFHKKCLFNFTSKLLVLETKIKDLDIFHEGQIDNDHYDYESPNEETIVKARAYIKKQKNRFNVIIISETSIIAICISLIGYFRDLIEVIIIGIALVPMSILFAVVVNSSKNKILKLKDEDFINTEEFRRTNDYLNNH